MPAIAGKKIPKYCRHKNRGYATINGKQVPFPGAFGSERSRQAYDAAIGEWLARGRQGTAATRPESITISQLCAGFYVHSQNIYRGPASLMKVKSMIGFISEAYGPTPAIRFGPQQLKGVMEKMQDVPCKNNPQKMSGPKKNLSRIYINAIMFVVKQMFRWAADSDMLPADAMLRICAVRPLAEGRCRARETERRRPASPAHVSAVLALALPTHKAMIELQMLTGMRPGEVCSLKAEEIKYNGKHGTWTYVPAHHKTERHGKKRVISIGPKAQSIIRPFLTDDDGGYLFRPANVIRERLSRWAASAKKGTRWRGNLPKRDFNEKCDPESLCRTIKEMCKRAGVPKWTPYQLRHLKGAEICATHGGRLEEAAAVLGHSNTKTTEIYAWTAMEQSANETAAAIMGEIG